jgi:calcipressin-2
MPISISPPSSNPVLPVSNESKTNTIIITSLPPELFESLALDTLRQHFSSYGRINQFAPIGAFGRVIIVYEDEDAAETAKCLNDPVVIESTEDR